MKEEEKKKLQNFIDSNNMKSISDYISKNILEKIKIEELTKKGQNVQDLKIPDNIPKNMYVVFVNGAIVGVGDSPSEVSLIAVQKFPNLPFFIEFNGVKNDKKIEYCFHELFKFIR